MMDLLQANPEIEVVITANDYIAIGAALAAEALGREDVAIFGNDGDTTGLEDIAAGKWDATVNTTPYLMGQVALQVAVDCLDEIYPGGWTETPTVIVDASNANDFLCRPENLYPEPSQEYACGAPAEEVAVEYTAPEPAFNPVPLEEGAQAACSALGFSGDGPVTIAYMPPATEFNYYQAIGAGIDDLAAELGIETFMLAPQSGSDIEGQMGMIQDVLTQDVDAIILSTHDEFAAAPLIEKAIEQGVAIIIVNSDIANFPTPVNAVVGYSQRSGTFAEGEYILDMFDGKAKVGVLEGLPGYHSTERIGGYLDAFEGNDGMVVIASLPTEWNVETGNTAMMDLLQANPEIEVVITANDYIAIGAALAAEALGRDDVAIFGNDGDTTGLEDIAAGKWDATVNTTPYLMGQVALQVAMDCLEGVYPGGWTETPTVIVDASNVNEYLCRPENLFPAPSKEYECD
jgi:ribose transport system substrate-binding protein